MRTPAKLLKSLQTSKFLNIAISQPEQKSKTCFQIKLESNGEHYAKNLEAQWQLTNYDNFTLYNNFKDANLSHLDSSLKRFDFINSPTFLNNFKILKNNLNIWPAVIKSKYVSNDKNEHSWDTVDLTSDFTVNSDINTYLLSDFIVNPGNGLEKFYNIQRARKIWWMRFSANPSRYFLEPFKESTDAEIIPSTCQSITIFARFPFGNSIMEHISLLPLSDVADETSKKKFELIDPRTDKQVVPTVIRSVINLELATTALLLDASDHKRKQILQINRKLAPFQCTVCLPNDDDDLRDLSRHLSFVLRRAGIRFCDNIINSLPKESQQQQLQLADNIGIPYALILDENTLKTGLMKLRSRDTSLAETIHISDIPNYLLNIFNN